MDDAEVGPHIIFPLASPLILLCLFICPPQSISTPHAFVPPPLFHAPFGHISAKEKQKTNPFLSCERCPLQKFSRAAAAPSSPACRLFKRAPFCFFNWRDTGRHLTHKSNAKCRITSIPARSLVPQQFMAFWMIPTSFYGTAVTVKHRADAAVCNRT